MNNINTCIYPHCSQVKYQEEQNSHSFCSRGHAHQFHQLNPSLYQATCKKCSQCSQRVFAEKVGEERVKIHPFCSKTCALKARIQPSPQLYRICSDAFFASTQKPSPPHMPQNLGSKRGAEGTGQRPPFIPTLSFPKLPHHRHIDPSTGRLKKLPSFFYQRQLTPLKKGQRLQTAYSDRPVVQFYKKPETPGTEHLGNFHSCAFTFHLNGQDCLFYNAEAAFQAAKLMALFPNDPRTQAAVNQLFNAREGDAAFAIIQPFNRQLTNNPSLRQQWQALSQKAMYAILMAKFSQNPDLAQKLVSTNEATLIENSGEYQNQRTWAVNSSGLYAGDGQNYLGRLLEIVREQPSVIEAAKKRPAPLPSAKASRSLFSFLYQKISSFFYISFRWIESLLKKIFN